MMKTGLKLLLAAALCAMPADVALADPPADQGIGYWLDFCRTVVLPSLPLANLGECVGYAASFSTPGYPAHECDSFLEIDPETFFEVFDSYSDCVRTLKGS
jgi:hypothetical protein